VAGAVAAGAALAPAVDVGRRRPAGGDEQQQGDGEQAHGATLPPPGARRVAYMDGLCRLSRHFSYMDVLC
jgi:hypothetical protein